MTTRKRPLFLLVILLVLGLSPLCDASREDPTLTPQEAESLRRLDEQSPLALFPASAGDAGAELAALGQAGRSDESARATSVRASFPEIRESDFYTEFKIISTYIEKLQFSSTVTFVDGYQRLSFHDHRGQYGGCYLGSELGTNHEYVCIIVDNSGPIASQYWRFNAQSNKLDGVYYFKDVYGGNSNSYALTGTRKGGACNPELPVDPDPEDGEEEDGVYYLPYIPKDAEFSTGLSFTNLGNLEQADILIEYFNKDGYNIGQQTASIPANGATSLMKNVASDSHGWARVTSTTPLHGLALAFGQLPTPMLEIDLQTSGDDSLLLPLAASTGGWKTQVFLVNPNPSEASATITFYPDTGTPTSVQNLDIPAFGSRDFDLAAFPGSGAARVTSDQAILGYLLFDGRTFGGNWLAGAELSPGAE